MKLLLIGENVIYDTNANGNCVWNLALALKEQGHDVHVMSQAVTKQQLALDETNGIILHWYFVPWNCRAVQLKKMLRTQPVKGAAALVRKVWGKWRYSDNARTLLRFREQAVFEKALCDVLAQERFDKVVAGFYPVEFAVTLARLKKSGAAVPPYWMYQLDAYVSNEAYTDEYRQERKAFFLESVEPAEGIFTTPLLYAGVCGCVPDKKERVFPLEFPLLAEKQAAEPAACPLEAGKINCVFAGMLYPKIREPDLLLNVLRLWAPQDVVFHFFLLNKVDAETRRQWEQGLEGKVRFHLRRPFDEMMFIMSRANVLVNIGNKLSNQLPSKILDYFSSGRPIINVALIDPCPAEPYFQKHPSALTLHAGEDTDVCMKKTRRFIEEHAQDATIPFEKIESIYSELTPKAVAQKVLAGFNTVQEKEHEPPIS